MLPGTTGSGSDRVKHSMREDGQSQTWTSFKASSNLSDPLSWEPGSRRYRSGFCTEVLFDFHTGAIHNFVGLERGWAFPDLFGWNRRG